MRLILLPTFLLITILLNAQIVTRKTAEMVARNFYLEKQVKKSANDIKDIQFIKEEKSSVIENSNYYILNIDNNKGFVIVSGSANTMPVLGYSLTGSFEQQNMPPEVKGWMDELEKQIITSNDLKIAASHNIKKEWDKYTNLDFINLLNSKQNLKSGEVTAVPPLLSTTWNQGNYYNTLCPPCASGGSGGRVWAGCVAAAQAQVMKYYNYPTQGVGQNSYTHWQYGLQSANFGTTTYNWASMPSHLSSNNSAVATLLYHCGVSVNMNYSPTGSGASGSAPRNSLINYFKYSDNAVYTSKSSYTEENWIKLLKNEIDNSRPIYYTGYGTDGHAFVCDGYQDEAYFHFNWGWGGAYDGYFYVTSLRPGGTNFTNSQAAIVGILPSTMELKLDSTNVVNLSCGTAYNGTTTDGQNKANSYKNSYWTETGKEKIHKITTTFTGRITAKITNLNGNDLDVFILKYANRSTCLISGDSIAILDNAAPGTYYIVVDGKNASEGAYTLKVSCPDNKADLLIENASANPNIIIPGSQFQVNSSVKNIGNATAAANSLYYYLSNDRTISGDDVNIGNSPVSSLPSKSKQDISTMLTIPNGTSEGNKYIILKVDATSIVDETDEELNTAIVSMQVPKPGQMDCYNAITLHNDVMYNGNTQTLGNSVISTYSCFQQMTNKEVIHKFTPTYSGLAELEFSEEQQGGKFLLLLAGCNENTCTQIFSSGGGEGVNGSRNFYVLGGTTYYLVADGNSQNGNTDGPYSIKLKFPEQCPKPIVQAYDINKCVGDPNSFLYTSHEYRNYLWKKDGFVIPGEVTANLSVSEPGDYTVEVTENGCAGTSNIIPIRYSPKPSPLQIAALGDTTFCEGGSVALQLTTNAYYIYQWTNNNIPIVGANALNFDAGASGTYRAEVTNGSCTVKSNTVQVIVDHSAFDQGDALGMKMTDLSSFWPFDGWGTDASGNNNYMNIIGPQQIKDRNNNYSAFSLDGVDDYQYTTKQYAHPDAFTVSVWFKTTTAGKIIGFDEQQTNRSSTNFDRHIYLDNTGLLYFGVEDGTIYTLHTTQTYNDDKWHLATATLSANGIKLYVDGKLKAQQASPTKGKNFSGYWKVGHGDLSGWTGNPGNTYFKGSVDDIAIYTKELTADEIEILYEKQYLNIYCQNDVICSASGTSAIVIENSEPGVTYQLYNNSNNNPIGSGIVGNSGTINMPTGTLNANTHIKIKAVNNSTLCEKQLDSIFAIFVNTTVIPEVSIHSNASTGTHCKGDSLVFNASILYGGATPVYNWKVNEIAIGNSNHQFISVSLNNNDKVSLEMTSSVSCASPKTLTSNIITASILAIPNKNVVIDGQSQFCEGEKVKLTGVTTTTMEWHKLGIGLVSTQNPYYVNNGGQYYLYLENSNGCSSISDTMDFDMLEAPVVDLGSDTSIYTNENVTLDAGNSGNYIWSTGETSQSIVVDGIVGSGNYEYSVKVTDQNGCTNSDTINVEVQSILGIDENSLRMKTIVFPNPSKDYLNIQFDEGISGHIALELINTTGQKVLRQECSINQSSQREKLDLNGLAKGTYYLKVIMDTQVAFYKIVIN